MSHVSCRCQSSVLVAPLRSECPWTDASGDCVVRLRFAWAAADDGAVGRWRSNCFVVMTAVSFITLFVVVAFQVRFYEDPYADTTSIEYNLESITKEA